MTRFMPFDCNFNRPNVHISRSIAYSIIALFASLAQPLYANNEIFPAVGQASAAVTWKDGYFAINGKPTFITSGEMHYSRIPKELWRDRIWRAKQLGFNCIQTYVFWNASEPTEGHWDFSGETDLDAWLSTLQEMGMYATVRVGPYCCAEWDDGGMPAWLLAKPGMTLRDGGPFEAAALKHLDQVEAIVAKHQIHRNGNVILVQLENEHPKGWGTDESFPYLKDLVDQARHNGLEIPVFLSGLHHGADPSGEKPYTVGASPWFTTEFWTGWIGKHGDMDPGMLAEKIRGTWKIIAFGGGGYDYYMVHGGTNFGYSGHTHDATYDYAAPIGETGKFNNFYQPARRAATFAQSFSSLLTGSHNDPTLAQKIASGLRVTARTNPSEGSFVLLDNFARRDNSKWISPDPSAYAAPPADASGAVHTRVNIDGTQYPEDGTLTIKPNEPQKLLLNIPWTKDATLNVVCTNVLLKCNLAQTEYWVCYGEPGDAGEVVIHRQNAANLPPTVQFKYPTDASVKTIDIDSGDGSMMKLLVMNTACSERTWLVNDKLYVGATFVLPDGRIECGPDGCQTTIYSAEGEHDWKHDSWTPPAPPAFGQWTWRDAAPESAVDAKTDDWQQSSGPMQLAAYNDFANRFGWYRTTLHRDAAGPAPLRFSGDGARKVMFLNGSIVTGDTLPCKAGDNALAILVDGYPRPTLYNWIGDIGDYVARGIWGSVSTQDSPAVIKTNWQLGSLNERNQSPAEAFKEANSGSWKEIAPDSEGKITVKKGRTWLRGTFDIAEKDTDSILDFSGLDGAVSQRYVNGKHLTTDSADGKTVLRPGQNIVLLRIDSRSPTSTLALPIRLWQNDPISRAPWRFHAGLDGLNETQIFGDVTNWKQFLAQAWHPDAPPTSGRPLFWHSTFQMHRQENMAVTLGLFTDGLAGGQVWLNGRNVGECPQKIPMYLPESWLNEGANDLVIFDVHGNSPGNVRLGYVDVLVTSEPR